MFLAKSVRHLSHTIIISSIIVILLAINKRNRINYKVIMYMLFVKVSCNYHLKSISPNFLCKLYTNTMSNFRSYLARFKALYGMECNYTIRFTKS